MDVSELEPVRKKQEQKNLEEMSIDALAAYILELRAEIVRTEEVIAAKEKAREGAEQFFRS